MPAIEIAGARLPSQTPERPLLKSHKALPRKRDIVPSQQNAEAIQMFPHAQVDDLTNGAAIATAPALPLTPPGAAEKVDTSEFDLRKDERPFSDYQAAGMLTPTHPQSPPTPEITPPRKSSIKRPTLGQTVHPSLSSRADSFRTARETVSSDEESEKTEIPGRSSDSFPQPAGQIPLSPTSLRRCEVPPDLENPKVISSNQPKDLERALQYDSVAKEKMDNNGGEATRHTSKRTASRKNYGHLTAKSADSSSRSPDNSVADIQHSEAPLARERSLRDRVRDAQRAIISPSMEQFGETIGWPSGAESPVLPDSPTSCRLSAVSTTSTIEVMVIESPQRIKRSLRHSEKRSSLRSVSSPITRSERTSIASHTELQPRLVHKAARITNQDRKSIASDISVPTSVTAVALQSKVDVIPVVVIPERRSSLKSSTSNSQDPSRTCSQRSSRRTAAAPGSRPGSLDLPRRPRKRTMSDSVPIQCQETDGRGRKFGSPVIPTRSSSLSAPTSTNNSRTTSLTLESLRQHTQAIDLELQKRQTALPALEIPATPADPYSHDDTEAPNVQSIIIGYGDMAHLRPPSLPFTQSVQSSSPGPVEISEATAVSLFAHNNRSLLLVDQQVQPESRAVQALRTEYRNKLDDPQTPEMPSQAAPLDVDSPLKNPRPPPKPPVCKVIPPTPMDEVDRQLGGPIDGTDSNGRLSRRLGYVRRAFGARPRSESSTSFARSLSMRSVKNRKSGKEIDSRLHPFWKPRGFWDDFAESEDEGVSQDYVAHPSNGEGYRYVNNSLGMPQQRIVIEGPPSLVRRSPEMRKLFDGMPLRHHASRGNLAGSRGFTSDILRTGSPLHRRRFNPISRWGLRLRFVTLRNLRRRLRRARQQRHEGKREARRAKLKQSIGGIVLVNSSTAN